MDEADNVYRELSQERMKTAEDRLRFAVEFSQIDLSNLRPGDLLNLRDDLCLFVHGHPSERVFPGGIWATEWNDSIREFSIEDLKNLQASRLHRYRSVIGSPFFPAAAEASSFRGIN